MYLNTDPGNEVIQKNGRMLSSSVLSNPEPGHWEARWSQCCGFLNTLQAFAKMGQKGGRHQNTGTCGKLKLLLLPED